MALTEIPIELSSTPSIVDGGNATAITIDSSENVSFATSGGLIKSIGGDVALVQGAVGVRINDAGSAISPTTASANSDGAVDLGVSNIRFKDLYLSGGAYLGGTAAANKLDDYEEGSFTTVGFRINASGYTPSMQYTKVGSMVNITARIAWTGTDNTTNALQFTLPFPVENVAASSTGAVFYSGTQINSGNPLCAYAGSGSSNVYFYSTAGGAFDQIMVNEVNGSYSMLFSFTYKTTQ
tara:strand:+ start:1024 stop:1737 length:714 start_codon:yes stop_codon:yes gene_type:complete